MPVHARNSAQKENIVTAAVQLFARQGYHRTSTREIARLADVSENTIFRHFDRKEDIFWTALRSRASVMKFRRDMMEGMMEGEAPEVVVPQIVEYLSDILNYTPELLRLVAVAFIELHWKAEAFCDECLSPAFYEISKYLALNMQKGRMRNLDPTMVTAALSTMVLVHPWLAQQAGEDKKMLSDSHDTARAYTTFWLDALAPKVIAHEAYDGVSMKCMPLG